MKLNWILWALNHGVCNDWTRRAQNALARHGLEWRVRAQGLPSSSVCVRIYWVQIMPISRFSMCLVWKMNRNRAKEFTWVNTAWLPCPWHLLLCKCHHSIPQMYTTGWNSPLWGRRHLFSHFRGQNYPSEKIRILLTACAARTPQKWIVVSILWWQWTLFW